MDDEARARFGEFVAARTPTLIRVAYLLTGDQHAAQDLLQTALTRTAARWNRVRHENRRRTSARCSTASRSASGGGGDGVTR